MAKRKPGLGRGLEALIGLPDSQSDEVETREDSLRQLAIDMIQPGKYQPRTGMDPDRLQELAESIKAQGLVQPVVVRPIGPGRYELIAGERRWRAAQLAELREIPAVIRDIPDQAAMAMALIENIQREDLNPLEEANALKRLVEEFGLTHQQAAEAVGRSRAAVSNLLRLLELAPVVRELLETRKLEMGHARALLSLDEMRQSALGREAAEGGWSVRETEERVRQALQDPSGTRAAKPAPRPDPDVHRLEQELSELLCAKVAVQAGRGGRGKLVVQYHSLDELDGILERIRGRESID